MPTLRFLLTLIVLVSGITHAIGQTSLQVGFWNVENLFDTTKSAATRDDDFTPGGKYEWTEERLVKKCQQIARVIHEIDAKNDLAILGLAEIENFSVLNRLNQDFIKRDMNIIHRESPDERGIDCALLYDPERYELVQSNYIPIFLAGDDKTRDIIEAEFAIPGAKHERSLHVFVNHWPSRWGGQSQTDPLRRKAAATLRTRIDEILLTNYKADIIILGDFNDHPVDPSLHKVLKASPYTVNTYPGDLINTTWDLHQDPNAGTMMYRGAWGVLDQIIISYGMMDRSGFQWDLNSTHTFQPDYLIETGGKYAGWPFRMYRSGKYQGGYSDHLPIVCRVSYSNN